MAEENQNLSQEEQVTQNEQDANENNPVEKLYKIMKADAERYGIIISDLDEISDDLHSEAEIIVGYSNSYNTHSADKENYEKRTEGLMKILEVSAKMPENKHLDYYLNHLDLTSEHATQILKNEKITPFVNDENLEKLIGQAIFDKDNKKSQEKIMNLYNQILDGKNYTNLNDKQKNIMMTTLESNICGQVQNNELSGEFAIQVLKKKIASSLNDENLEKLTNQAIFDGDNKKSQEKIMNLYNQILDGKDYTHLNDKQKNIMMTTLESNICGQVKNNELSGEFAHFVYNNKQCLGNLINDENAASIQAKLLQTMYNDKEFWNKLDTKQQSMLLQDAFNSPNIMSKIDNNMRKSVVDYKLQNILNKDLYKTNDCQIVMSELSQATKYAFTYSFEEDQKRITDFGLTQLKNIQREKYEESPEDSKKNREQVLIASNITLAIDSGKGENGYLMGQFNEVNNKNAKINDYAAGFIKDYRDVMTNSTLGGDNDIFNDHIYSYKRGQNVKILNASSFVPTEEKKEDTYYFNCNPNEIELDRTQYIAVKRYLDSNKNNITDNMSDPMSKAIENMKAAIGRYEEKNPSAKTLYDYSKNVYFENYEGLGKAEINTINELKRNLDPYCLTGTRVVSYPTIGKGAPKGLEDILDKRETKTNELAGTLKNSYGIDVPSLGYNYKEQSGQLYDVYELEQYRLYFVSKYIDQNGNTYADIATLNTDLNNSLNKNGGFNGKGKFNDNNCKLRLIDDKGVLIKQMDPYGREGNDPVTFDVRGLNKSITGANPFTRMIQRGKLNVVSPDRIPASIESYIGDIRKENMQYASNAQTLVETTIANKRTIADNNMQNLISSIQPTWSYDGSSQPLYSYIQQAKGNSNQVDLSQNPQKGNYPDLALVMRNNRGRE